MEGKGFKISFLVIEGVFLLAELISLLIFLSEDLIIRPLYLLLMVICVTGAFLLTLKGEKLPKLLKNLFQITFLFAALYRAGEMAYYLGKQAVIVFKILFLNTGTYDVKPHAIGYVILLLFYLIGLLYYLFFAYRIYDVLRYPEEQDRFYLALQPQYGILLAQFFYPASSLMAHVRGEAEGTVSFPIRPLWFWLAEAAVLLVCIGYLFYRKAHPEPEAKVSERNQGRKKKKYRNSGKPKKKDSSKPAYRRK